MTTALKVKLNRNNFDNAEIINLSRDYKHGSLLLENHGVIYVWYNGLFRKTGELSSVTGKTPSLSLLFLILCYNIHLNIEDVCNGRNESNQTSQEVRRTMRKVEF